MLAVSPEERGELELEEPHTELADRYVDSHLGIEKGCMEKSGKRPCIFHSSVPDPHVFGPPGSFFHQAEKNSKINLDSYCFVTFFGLFIFEK